MKKADRAILERSGFEPAGEAEEAWDGEKQHGHRRIDDQMPPEGQHSSPARATSHLECAIFGGV